MDFLQNLTYLQIIWLGLIALLAVEFLLVLAGTLGDVKKWNEQPKDTVGWLEFRKRPAVTILIMLVVTIWLEWNVIGAYYFGREPSQFFQPKAEFLLSPRNNGTSATAVCVALIMFTIYLVHELFVNINISIFSRRQSSNIIEASFLYAVTFLVPFMVIAEGPQLVQQEGCLSFSNITIPQMIGEVIMFAGMYMSHVTRKALAKLRRNRFGHITTTDYKQPKGGFFDLVGCPLYLADLLMLLGLGLILNFTFTWVLWMVEGTMFYAVLATATKQYYVKKFDDYPRDKKMLIPFLF